MAPPERLDESPDAGAESRDGVTTGSAFLGAIRCVGGRVGTAVRGSLLYNWLTKEPEPDVIVIELRETWTVGPVLSILDYLIGWATPYWRNSGLHDWAVALSHAGERLAATRGGQFLARLLAPPDPPAEEGQRE